MGANCCATRRSEIKLTSLEDYIESIFLKQEELQRIIEKSQSLRPIRRINKKEKFLSNKVKIYKLLQSFTELESSLREHLNLIKRNKKKENIVLNYIDELFSIYYDIKRQNYDDGLVDDLCVKVKFFIDNVEQNTKELSYVCVTDTTGRLPIQVTATTAR